MSKIIDYYKKYWFYNLIMFFILAFLSLLGFFLVYFLQDKDLKACCNASAVGFAISFSFMAFSILSHFGAFDTLGYGGATIMRMFSYKQEKKYQDLVDYKHIKSFNRNNTYPFITYGFIALIFLIVLIIFEVKIKAII